MLGGIFMNTQILEQMIQHVKTTHEAKLAEKEALKKRVLEISAWQNLSQFAGQQHLLSNDTTPFRQRFQNVFNVDLKELEQEQSEIYGKIAELKGDIYSLSQLLAALEIQLKQTE